MTAMTKFQKTMVALVVVLIVLVAGVGITVAVVANNARIEAAKAACEANYGFGGADYFYCVETIK